MNPLSNLISLFVRGLTASGIKRGGGGVKTKIHHDSHSSHLLVIIVEHENSS